MHKPYCVILEGVQSYSVDNCNPTIYSTMLLKQFFNILQSSSQFLFSPLICQTLCRILGKMSTIFCVWMATLVVQQ